MTNSSAPETKTSAPEAKEPASPGAPLDAVEASPRSEKPDRKESPPSVKAPTRSEVRIRLFGRTDVGQVREHNEDNFIVADLTKESRGLMEADRNQTVGPRGTLLGVCDGMGGAAAGEVASQLAVDIIYQRMAIGEPPEDKDALAARLVHAIEAAGLRIFSEAKLDRTRRGMGTTATIATLMDDHLFLGQVGDSRAYILRGDRLVQVTRDQSLVNQLIEAGQLTEEEAETFEHNNIILQALGTADTVQVDLTYVSLRQGDTLLLCSDGLSGMVRFDEIREVLTTVRDPLEACRVLTERANQAGGHDNITVIVSKFEGAGLPSSSHEDDLRYCKYPLPEGSGLLGATIPGGGTSVAAPATSNVHEPEGAAMAGAPAPRGDSRPPPGSSRLSDHGPSPSKVTHTMMPGQLDAATMAAIRGFTNAGPAPSPGGPVHPQGASQWPTHPAPAPVDLDPIDLP